MRRFRFSALVGKITVTTVGLLIVFILLYPVFYVIFSSLAVGQSIITSLREMAK